MRHSQTYEIMNELRDRSKNLLEIAKTGVEKAIEENEEVAINWINEQLKNLGIDYSPPLKMTTKGD